MELGHCSIYCCADLIPNVLLAEEVVSEALVAVEDGQIRAAHVAHTQLLVRA